MARPEISSTLLRIAGKTAKRILMENKNHKIQREGQGSNGALPQIRNIKKRKIGKSITKSFVPQQYYLIFFKNQGQISPPHLFVVTIKLLKKKKTILYKQHAATYKIGRSKCKRPYTPQSSQGIKIFRQKYIFGPYIMGVFSIWSLNFKTFQFSPCVLKPLSIQPLTSSH